MTGKVQKSAVVEFKEEAVYWFQHCPLGCRQWPCQQRVFASLYDKEGFEDSFEESEN